MFVKKRISSAGIDYLLDQTRHISSELIQEYVSSRLYEEDNDWFGMREELDGNYVLEIGEAVFRLPKHFVVNEKVNEKLKKKYIGKVLDL
jgi:hypothetical protein